MITRGARQDAISDHYFNHADKSDFNGQTPLLTALFCKYNPPTSPSFPLAFLTQGIQKLNHGCNAYITVWQKSLTVSEMDPAHSLSCSSINLPHRAGLDGQHTVPFSSQAHCLLPPINTHCTRTIWKGHRQSELQNCGVEMEGYHHIPWQPNAARDGLPRTSSSLCYVRRGMSFPSSLTFPLPPFVPSLASLPSLPPRSLLRK